MIFNTKYANQGAIKNNILHFFLYYVSSPIVYISFILGLTPNFLTFASILVTLSAIFFLYLDYNLIFQILFFFSLMLDYADGPLARKTRNVSKGLNFDHISDLFKISFITASTALIFKDFMLVIIGCIFIFLLLFNEFLIKSNAKSQFQPQKAIPFITMYFSKKIPNVYVKIMQNIYNMAFTFDGHSLLLLLFIPKSILSSQLILSYFSFLMIKSISLKFYYLRKI